LRRRLLVSLAQIRPLQWEYMSLSKKYAMKLTMRRWDLLKMLT
jgi:hypothetical protein